MPFISPSDSAMESAPHPHVRTVNFLLIARILFGVFLLVFFLSTTPTSNFPERTIVSVPRGATLSETAEILYARGVIRYPFAFKAAMIIRGAEKRVVAGDYFLLLPESAWHLAGRISEGHYGILPVSITVPEGATVREIAAIMSRHIPDFNERRFLDIALTEEGYLFPDTYFFFPNTDPADIVARMKARFLERVASIDADIQAFGRPLSDVVTMASLLEKEARETNTREIIAGILWRRERIGMPLQVDAVFPYIIGKNTYEVSLDDLATDSPYNTYTRRGLPPGPIANPGLDALLAAVSPRETVYLYYLSDKDGVMHYSEDFEGHKRNKEKYLR